MKDTPDVPVLCNLEVVLMPNGEVISTGKTLGWFKDFRKYLTIKVAEEKTKVK